MRFHFTTAPPIVLGITTVKNGGCISGHITICTRHTLLVQRSRDRNTGTGATTLKINITDQKDWSPSTAHTMPDKTSHSIPRPGTSSVPVMSTDGSVGSSSPIDFSLAPPPLNFVPPEELNNIVFVSEINSRNDSPGESDDDDNGSANDVSGSSDNTGEAADLSESMIAIPLPPLVLPPAQLARQLED
eukprot:2489787-Rhodomonas_salina.1